LSKTSPPNLLAARAERNRNPGNKKPRAASEIVRWLSFQASIAFASWQALTGVKECAAE
jgi:hypothetical protein